MNEYPRLKDLGHWRSGGTPPSYDEALWDGDIPWISAKDIDSTRLREPTAFISSETARRHSCVVDAGAVIIIARGMALAHGLPVVLTDREVAFNQDLRALLPGPSVDPGFLHYSFIGHRNRLAAHIDRAAHGTARVIDSMYCERIWVPPLEMQRPITAFLDREIQRIRALLERADELAKNLWEPVFAAFAEEAYQWPRGRIHYRFDVQLGKMLDEKCIDQGDVAPYLGNVNVQWDRFDLDNLKAMTFSPADRRRFDLCPGDLLVCEGGEVGRSAVWNGELNGCYYQKALHRVRPRAEDSTRYLMYSLRLLHERGDFGADGTGSTILHLPAERLRATCVPLPPPEVQRAIAARADTRSEKVKRTDQRLRSLMDRSHEYRDALITEAVTGQLDVTRVSEAQMDERAHAAMEGEPLEAVR